MADLSEFTALVQETAEKIRARIDADANAGVAPTDDGWIDVTEGGVWADLTQAPVLEFSRLWDFAAVEVAASMFPAFAWGESLDRLAEIARLERLDAAKASGEVTFSGTDGTLIATGTEVGVEQTDADSDPVTFVTTAGGTIASGSVTLPVEASDSGPEWNVSPNDVSLLLSPIAGVSAVANAALIGGGVDVESDEDLRERVLAAFRSVRGAGTAADLESWARSYPGVGFAAVTPLWAGAGTALVVVTDPDNKPVAQAVVDGVQTLLDPPVTAKTSGSHTLPVATLNLDDTSVLGSDGSVVTSKGTVAYTGKTATTLTGCTGGSGVVASGETVKQYGQGRGMALVGEWVTVTTPDTTTVTVASTITAASGYSLTGSGGTIPLTDSITAALAAYFAALKPGDDVVAAQVLARMVTVDGVADASAPVLNGGAAGSNVGIAADHVAALGTVTLS